MKIAAVGFAADQCSKLERILRLSRSHPYRLVPFDPTHLPDLLLVFGRHSLQLSAISGLPSSYRSRLILVQRERSGTAEYPQIGYPLVSSRVLQALDRLTCANEVLVADDAEPGAADRYARHLPPAALAAQPAPPPACYRVLVVDDSKAMQHALALQLKQQFPQLQIDFADDGASALAQAARAHYDFIFLDIMMPGIDGFETCTRLRQLGALKKTPIIMLSSKTSPLDEVKGIMAGSSTYLTKPIVPEEFQQVMARIRRWIEDFGQPLTALPLDPAP